MKIVSKVLKNTVQKALIAFKGSNSMVTDRDDTENKMEMILNAHNKLYSATREHNKEEKSKCHVWK